MSQAFLLTTLIVILKSNLIFGNHLEVETRKPRIDRNNVINKGIWVRNKENAFEKATGGEFIFRGNTVDVDNILQGDFNAFDDNSMPNTAFLSSYVERNKRASNANHVNQHRRYRKSLKNCDKKDCAEDIDNSVDSKSSLIKSTLISKLKPSTVFNDYPYEIAILLGNNKVLNQAKNYSAYEVNDGQNNDTSFKIPTAYTDGSTLNVETLVLENLKASEESKKDKVPTPKRSMELYVSNADIELGAINKTDDGDLKFSKVDRNVFDLKDSSWRSDSPRGPIPMISKFKVKALEHDETRNIEENKHSKSVTERGLVKILAMLTKTFKKIMRQHEDIQDIHKKFRGTNNEFLKKVEGVYEKLREFDEKYLTIMKFNDRIKLLGEKLETREEYFKNKETELSKNLMDFENQQKKFLAQQRQFYNIQKLMLAQNEKINSKQNAITKTQSEISHRQNNFARILKKAKQIYTESKHHTTHHKPINSILTITKNITEMNKIVTTSTPPQVSTTDTVKINLFALQSAAPIKVENQDNLLLKEKDEKPVDDLVYKYYFNNTFIDNLMKSFLSSFLTVDNGESTLNVKNKRQEISAPLGTTILLPVSKTAEVKIENASVLEAKPLNRERRWIKNHARRKSHKKNHTKASVTSIKDNAKTFESRNLDNVKNSRNEGKGNDDPFVAMATNFCNAMNQNTNAQVLGWCIEKALRKLQNIDMKTLSRSQPPANDNASTKPIQKFGNGDTSHGKTLDFSTPPPLDTTVLATEEMTTLRETPSQTPTGEGLSSYVTVVPTEYLPIITLPKVAQKFFPDNEQLETNLRQYDLKPDTEGNVYYDGSLHASDVIKDDHRKHKEEEDDIMPGLDSNSKIDNIDPENFDPQGMRRAMIQRMRYETMLKRMTYRV